MAVNKMDETLRSWRPLCEHLMTCDEKQVLALLHHENKTRQRPYVVKRIFARYSKLRRERELREVALG